MELNLEINEQNIIDKVKNPNFGKFVAKEWKRLIDPYTPRNTGLLVGYIGQEVDILPFKIHYKVNYAEKVYFGYHMNFRKINPFSTYEWDLAAERAGQKDKLYRTLNNALKSGRY